MRKVLRAVADYDPDYYDMYEDANEAFFAQLYVARILQHAEAFGIRPPATLLEAGCQAGRLAIPLARQGFRVTGIDTSGFALRRARAHARAAGLAVTFRQGDLFALLQGRPPQYDVVVCAEVVYLSRRYRQMLERLASAVRPGGLLCVSHRPKGYYLLEAMRRRDVRTALEVLSRAEGPFRDSAYYNWQTTDELHALYEGLGLQTVAMHPIDRFAWLTGVSPSALTQEQRRQWRELELRADGMTAGASRYLLVIASKPS